MVPLMTAIKLMVHSSILTIEIYLQIMGGEKRQMILDNGEY